MNEAITLITADSPTKITLKKEVKHKVPSVGFNFYCGVKKQSNTIYGVKRPASSYLGVSKRGPK